MTKQEQIEEMAKIIDCGQYCGDDCRQCKYNDETLITFCRFGRIAEMLYNKGYHRNDTSTFHTYSDSVLQKQTKQWLIERIRELEQAHLDDEWQLDNQRKYFKKILDELFDDIKSKCGVEVDE